MAKKRGLSDSSVREKWQKIFNSLAHMLRTQQSQLETLVKERKLFEDHIKMQQERWVSDVRLLEDQVAQAKQKLLLQEMVSAFSSAKSNLLIRMKQTETALNKHKLEYAEDELTDFKALLECIAKNYSGVEVSDRNSPSTSKRKRGDMKAEVERLKHDCKKLALEKDTEVSALLNEKSFVWNQYNTMESKYASELKSKHSEIKLANEKISDLLTRVDQLQFSNNEKEDTIARLKSELARKGAVTSKCSSEVSRSSHELESSRKLKIASTTPLLRPCTRGAKTISSGGNGVCSSSNGTVEKESTAAQLPTHVKDSGKGSRRSKRKDEVISVSETPKLFSSKFKVPKLKTPTPVR